MTTLPSRSHLLREMGHAVLMVILCNLPFWLLSLELSLNRPVLSVDGLLLAAMVRRSPLAVLTAVAMAWTCDGLLALSYVFRFPSVSELLRAFEFLTELHGPSFLESANLLASMPFAACAALIYWGASAKFVPSMLVATPFAVAILLVDALNGTSMLSSSNTRTLSANIAGSAVATLTSSLAKSGGVRDLRVLPQAESIGYQARIPEWMSEHPDRSTLIVIVESLGAPRQPRLREWLDRQLLGDTLHAALDVQRMDVPFSGLTVAGELRTLCSLGGNLAQLTPALAAARCIPARLAAMGMEPVGMHGFSKRMFDRQAWWPMIGLNSTWFAEEFELQDAPRCGGGFRGTCDAFVIERAIDAIRERRRFAYVLTLNTHLPLESRSIPSDLAAACSAAAATPDVCQLLAAAGVVLNSIRAQLASLAKPPLVVVVGDHAPPFAATESRLAFDQQRVPGWILRPTATTVEK